MEIDRVTIFMELKKGGINMAKTKNIKVLREGKIVAPNLKRVAKKAVKDTRKSYPY
jgi:hypothetical protein